ncbi:MAG: PQQ-like beta-propeller repeat protein [Bacteroidales bacterium]|nr:PQQ-like beta-propeller repeat protein [Bacteroidales bacterium]
MKKKIITSCILSFLLLMQTFIASSQQSEPIPWNQFKGFYRNGVASGNTLAEKIPENGPKMLWKKKTGSAFSEITIMGNQIYTMLSEKTDSVSGLEFAVAFDAKTGNEIWKTLIDSIFIDVDGWGDGPRSTPAIGQDFVYSFSGRGKLTATSKTDGKIAWQVDFVKEFGSTIPRWGFANSPLLIGDLVVMEAGGSENRAFIAFDAKTGKVVWAKGKGNSTYNSPSVANIDGETQIIFANGIYLYSFNAQGDTLWTLKTPIGNPTALPLVFDSNKVFISAIRNTGFIVAEFNKNGAKELINGTAMKNDYSTSVYYDGYIYGFNVAALTCISATTGEKKWTKRGFGKGSLILVDDKLLVLSDQGKIIQVKATPDAYTEQGSFQAIEGKSWTAPSFSDGKVYVRNLTEMACFDLN